MSRKKISRSRLIDWEVVGQRIKALRQREGTQAAFAAKVDVSQGYLSSMERGQKEIGPEVLLKISIATGKSIDWILIGKERGQGK